MTNKVVSTLHNTFSNIEDIIEMCVMERWSLWLMTRIERMKAI